MQNTKNVKDGKIKEGKGNFFARVIASLKEKDEREVRSRLSSVISFALCVTVTYFLGGAKLFFGAYPLCLALACSTRDKLFPIAVGSAILIITGELPMIYAFACVATVLIRVLASSLPAALAELQEREGRAAGEIVIREEQYPSVSDGGQGRSTVGARRSKSGRVSGGKAVFCEDLHIKLLSAALGGLLCGTFLLIGSDFSFYSLCATLFLTFSCPVCVLLMGGYLGEERYKREWYGVISAVFIASAVVYAAADKSIIGMPMAPFLAMLITLYMTSSKGMIVGGIAAMLCGLVFNAVYTPLLVIVAIMFCLISAVKRNAGLAVVCALVVIWCYYIGGADGLVGVLPPMLLAIPVYMIADKYREMMYAPYDHAAALSGGVFFAEAVTEKNKNEMVRERLGALSEAFSSLSETFYKLSDRFRRPDTLGIKRISESAFETHCNGCRNREICWGAGYSRTLDAINRLTEGVHKSGTVSLGDLGESFGQMCFRGEQIISTVNAEVSRMTEDLIKGEKAGFFAANYDDITAILRDALNSDGDEYETDMEASKKIFGYLYEQGFKVSGVVVYGKRCLHIVVKGVSLLEKMGERRTAEICARIEEIVGVPLTEPAFEVGRDGVMMLLYSKPLFCARCAHGHVAAATCGTEGRDELYVDPFSDAEELCGDMTNSFITDASYFYSLISDGMGSGAEAAFVSGVCSMFIEKMLCAGNRADITLRMLNNVIRSENMGFGSECSATVDLCELDLISGAAHFIKSGAAPTYIARGETVYKISSRTMPVGIIKDADARVTRFEMKKGDIIIMMSDGCCPDSDDCAWLVEYLCRYTGERKRALDVDRDVCRELCDSLLDLAVKSFPADKERDDISVSVIMIE